MDWHASFINASKLPRKTLSIILKRGGAFGEPYRRKLPEQFPYGLI